MSGAVNWARKKCLWGNHPSRAVPEGHWQRFISIPVIRAMRKRDLPDFFALVCAADEKERFVPGMVWFTHPKA